MPILGLEPPQFFAFDPDTGTPLIGGKVYTYEPGTTTDKVAYRDQAGAVAHTNPIILGQLGNATIFGDGLYDVAIYDADDVLVLTLSDFSAPITESDVDAKIADAISASSLGYGAQTVSTSSTLSTTAAAKLVKVDASAGTVTLTLPSAATMLGRAPIAIARVDTSANRVIIDPNGTEQINGTTSIDLVPGANVLIYTDGAAWFSASIKADNLSMLEAFGTAGGTANTLTLTTAYSWSAPRTGERRAFRASVANTGAATLQVGAQSAIALRTVDNANNKQALVGGEIQIGDIYDVIFDGTHWVLLNPFDLIADVESGSSARAAANSAAMKAYVDARVPVAPGDAPIYACRAWGRFDASSGAVVMNGSANVASVVRNSAGNFTVTFTEPMPDANYSVVTTAMDDTASTTRFNGAFDITANGFSISTTSDARNGNDLTHNSFAVFA